MASKTFATNNNVTLTEFISELKAGDKDFFQALRVPESHFEDASFDELLSNQDDVIAGVNRVQKNFSKIHFDIFDGCLIKHHDDGDLKIIFYTTSNDSNKIIAISKILFHEFGTGYFKDTEQVPFSNVEKIVSLSNGNFENEHDSILHVWLFQNLSILLQYKTDPFWQFSLMITKKAVRILDTSIRRNGTILDLLTLDIKNILTQEAIMQNDEYVNGELKFVDYIYQLPENQIGIFDMVRMRIFNSEKVFKDDIYTHLTLYSSTKIQAERKIQVVEKLIKLYGQDSRKTGEFEMYERDILEKNGFWTGRYWDFNQQHGLFNSKNPSEKMSYDVSIDNIDDQEGFRITIAGYNELVSLFGLSN